MIVECPSRVAGMRKKSAGASAGAGTGAGGRGPSRRRQRTRAGRSSAIKTNKEVRSAGVHARPLFWIHYYG